MLQQALAENLVSLSLPAIPAEEWIHIGALTALTDLIISAPEHALSDGLNPAQAMTSLTGLRRLEISLRDKTVQPASLGHMDLGPLSQLTDLAMYNIPDDFALAGTAVHLKHLRIDRHLDLPYEEDQLAVRRWGALDSLTHLDLQSCNLRLCEMQCLQQLPNLQRLRCDWRHVQQSFGSFLGGMAGFHNGLAHLMALTSLTMKAYRLQPQWLVFMPLYV